MRTLLAAVLCSSLLLGCRDPRGDAEAERAAMVAARFGAMEISVGDVDARILALPAHRRPRPGQDLDAWYAEQVQAVMDWLFNMDRPRSN